MEALQKSGHPLYGPPGVGFPVGYPVPYQYRQVRTFKFNYNKLCNHKSS